MLLIFPFPIKTILIQKTNNLVLPRIAKLKKKSKYCANALKFGLKAIYDFM